MRWLLRLCPGDFGGGEGRDVRRSPDPSLPNNTSDGFWWCQSQSWIKEEGDLNGPGSHKHRELLSTTLPIPLTVNQTP